MSINPLDDKALRDVQAFKPNARPMIIAVSLNLLVAGLFLGVPYYRGKLATRDALQAFGETAGCILGGTPTKSFGLALPAGERDHFAELVLHAGADWPARCVKPLARVMPEEATFLWPSVKTAIGDVRATAKLVDRELGALQEARTAGVTRVPERPLLALARLRAALTLLARAAGVSESIDAQAIVFDEALASVAPSRLPLNAGQTAATDVWLDDDGVQALALDGRGLSWLSVAAGEIDRFRVKRSSLLRGTLRTPDGAFAAFAMPSERCAEQPDHCVRRATGIADLALGTQAASNALEMPEPRWLAAHPHGRVDRCVLVSADGIDVLALANAEGALELRRFSRAALSAPPAPPDAAEAEAAMAEAAFTNEPRPRPPLLPTDVWPIAGAATDFDALLLAGSKMHPTQLAVARVEAEQIRTELIDPTRNTAEPIALGEVAGQKPWITTFRDPQRAGHTGALVLAFGSESALTLVQVDRDAIGTPSVKKLARAALPLGEPLTPEDPHGDRVRLVRGQTSLALLARTSDGELIAIVCESERCEQRSIARDVASFDGAFVATDVTARSRELLMLAWSGVRDPSVLVTSVEHRGPMTKPRVVAGCWDPAAGLCGAPTLAALDARVVLASREGGDLRAIESLDAGASWHALASLSARAPATLDPSQPMDQHRLRKGLEK